jgi:hypothetical protein
VDHFRPTCALKLVCGRQVSAPSLSLSSEVPLYLSFAYHWGANEADKHFYICGAFGGASLNYFSQLVCWL